MGDVPGAVLAWLIPLGTLILGGAGVGGIVKALADKKAGIQAGDRADNDALLTAALEIAKAQVELLVEPMRVDVAALRKEVGELRAEVEEKNRIERRLVRKIRELREWIARHVTNTDPADPIPEFDPLEDQ